MRGRNFIMNIVNELKSEYGYSSYDMAIVKYVLVSIVSELSKLILFGIFFYKLGFLTEFSFAILLLLFLRINGGGLHCKHYISCFLLTFMVLGFSIIILPYFLKPSYIWVMIITCVCMIINYFIGPVASPFRPSPNSLLLKNCKNNSFLVIFTFILFVNIFHSNALFDNFIAIGFWTILLHTLQLIAAKFFMKGGYCK